MKKIFIVAGDPSGDQLAAQLVQSMKKLNPDLKVTGLGGNKLKEVSDVFLENIVHQHVFGFFISPQKIFYFRRILNQIIRPQLSVEKFDAVVTVDFYGFNSCVARMAKTLGHKVFYYASPQFWASRPKRADRLREFVDLFLCLFPFEIDFYESRKLPVKFVGHPLLDKIPTVPKEDPADKIEKIVGLLPGSRPDEIIRHLPIIRQACALIKAADANTRFILFTVPNVDKHLYGDVILGNAKDKVVIELIEDNHFEWRTQLDMAITASGMETLENALIGIPMVVMYKTSWINYWIAKSLINIPHIGMPNLLAGKEIVPEFIQSRATPANIAQPIIRWLKNPSERVQLRRVLLALRDKFGDKGASERAAQTILEKVA